MTLIFGRCVNIAPVRVPLAIRYGVMEQLSLALPATRRAPDPRLDDPAWLAAAYATRDMASIAAELGCSPTTVGARMQQHGIRPRRAGQPPTTGGGPVDDLLHSRVAADLARGHVGETVLATRIRALAIARKTGDPAAVRAALVDLGAASVAWAHGLPGDTPGT